jgi:hypothetical protein
MCMCVDFYFLFLTILGGVPRRQRPFSSWPLIKLYSSSANFVRSRIDACFPAAHISIRHHTSAYVSTSQLHSSSANFVRSNIHACFPAAPHNIYPRRNSLGHTQPQPPTHPHPHHTHTHTHTHTHPPTHPPLLYIYIYILKLLCMCASSYADGCSVLIR